MNTIRRTREFPFLLTVAALFVVAIVHLGIQIWADPDQRNSVSALEAPVKAPKISSPTVVPDPEPPAEPTEEPPAEPPADEAAETEGQPEGEPAPEPAPADEPAPAQEEPAVPVEVKAPPKPAEPVKPPPAVVPPAKPAKAPEKAVSTAGAKPVVAGGETTVKVVKAEPLKPARKSSRKKVRREPEVPEYVVPSEWNWFSKPMTMVHNGNEWVLTTENATASDALTTVEPKAVSEKSDSEAPESNTEQAAEKHEDALSVQAEPQSAPEVRAQPESEEANKDEHVAPAAPAVVTKSEVSVSVPPFERALAKMAARRAKRNAEAERLAVKLPSLGGTSEKVPGSLLKMIDTLGDISHKSPDAAPVAGVTEAAGTATESASANDVKRDAAGEPEVPLKASESE